MKFITTVILPFVVLLIVSAIYHPWFTKGLISAPDLPYLFAQRLGDFHWLPAAWSSVSGNGFGGSTFSVLNLDTYLHAGVQFLIFYLHIPWSVAVRMMFFWPFLIVGIASSYYFCLSVLKKPTLAYIGVLVYMSNTYILMLAGGGQLGLMLSYAFVPLVLGSYMNRQRGLFTIATALLLLFDLRFSLLVFTSIALYTVIVVPRSKWRELFVFVFVPAIVVAGIHGFWLLPMIFSPAHGLPSGYDNPGWLSFLSVANFSHTFSLLHPNWPENIFGKTYFMRPEFLVVPLLAYGSLFFLHKKVEHRKVIVFFALLGLIGAFLAKGVTPLFGTVYAWLFVHVPFFSGFRDPTKFYLYVVIAYSILIPFGLDAVAMWVRRKFSKIFLTRLPVVYAGFVCIWVALLLPVWRGELRGTFVKSTMPSEYFQYEKLMSSQQTFSRTLVMPWRNRYIFETERHPVIDGRDVFGTSDVEQIVESMTQPGIERKLQSLAIQYIIVPEDTGAEIFLSDRKSDQEKRAQVIHAMDVLPYLSKHKEFDDVMVYELKRPIGHFFRMLPNLDYEIYASTRVRATLYDVAVTSTQRPIRVVFSERYDPAWQLWDGEKIIPSQETSDGLNSFVLDTNITGQVSVRYANESLLTHSCMVSMGVGGALLLIFLYRLRKKRGVWGTVSVFLIIIVLTYAWRLLIAQQAADNNIVFDNHIRVSPEWKRVENPFTERATLASLYGGSQIQFSVRDSHQLAITMHSPNTERYAVGMDIFIDDIQITRSPKVHGEQVVIPLTPGTHAIRIRQYCASSIYPCELGIERIDIAHTSMIETNAQPLPMLAVLGDSITSSFGNLNYSYLLADELGYQLHNAGIFGSAVSVAPGWDAALDRFERDVSRFRPQVIIIFLGTNDLARGIPLETFRKNYAHMLMKIQEQSPKATILALGLLRRQDYAREHIALYSGAIAQSARDHGVRYMDPYMWLAPNDFQDEVHPSIAAQPKLAAILSGVVGTITK